MSRKNSLIIGSLLCLIAACGRNETGHVDSPDHGVNVVPEGLQSASGSEVDPLKLSSPFQKARSPSAESIRQAVYASKTVKSARVVVIERINGILGEDQADDRLYSMRELAKIVSDWPIDKSSPSNHANSHHLKFKMELEIFDGFVRLGKMEEAWRGMLDSMIAYKGVLQKAKAQVDECVKRCENVPGDMTARMERRKALEYFRCVENDYQCAKLLIRDKLIPNVGFKFGIPVSVEKEIEEILEDTSR